MGLFATDPVKSWLVSLVGLAAFVVAVASGLNRWGGLEAIVLGTWMAMLSGFFWYASAIAPLGFPNRPHISAGCNVAAACFAAGSACYLVPDANIPGVLNAIGAG